MADVIGRQSGRTALVFVLIGSALVSLGCSQYRATVTSAQEDALRRNLVLMRDALDHYVSDRGKCPDSLTILLEARYIRVVPIDPMTKSSTTWRLAHGPKACDVRSGALQLARDGSRYADW
jgi:general secretion pathway protein G